MKLCRIRINAATGELAGFREHSNLFLFAPAQTSPALQGSMVSAAPNIILLSQVLC